MSERWQVEVREGQGGSVLRYVFAELPITIGRHEGNDVRLPRRFVSGFHARIERASGELSVLDVSRTNGVCARLDGGPEQRISREQPQALHQCNNEFSIGPYRIRVERAAVQGRAAASRDAAAGASSGPLSLPSLGLGPESSASRDSASLDSASFESSGLDSRKRASHRLPSLPVAAAKPRALRGAGAASERRALEAVALTELEELLRRLAPGQRLDSPERVSELVQRLRLALELSCRGLVRLRRGQRRCAGALQLPRLDSDGQLRAESGEQLLERLLDERLPLARLGAGLKAEFQALARHQVALLDGMIEGAAALAHELSPERIEARAERQRNGWLPLAGRLRALRRAYREQHAQLCRRDGVLSLLFGRAFREAYAAYLASSRAQEGGGSARWRGELG